jgi:predicted ATPase/DNA-binding winged helix-turn-helix (wHTH) protein
MAMAESVFRFDRAELRVHTRELCVDGVPVALGARAFDLLQALVTHRDRLLSKHALLEMVWPNLVVEENNLQVQVSTLRKLLGSKVIATVPGRGYRFAATLIEEGPPLVPPPPPVVAPPSARGQAGNLRQGPALLGRAADLAAVSALVRTQRLVSLLGGGGIGKTSLARAVAWELSHGFADGAWLVSLAEVADAATLPLAVARVLEINLPGRDPLNTLAERLPAQMLLVLDNCEHLTEAVAAFVERLLHARPGLHVLLTSQEPLRLAREQQVRLDALAVPAPDARGPVLEHGAVALFVARAQAALPGFVLEAGQEEAVVEICRALDGVPLALEFAAARVPLLGVEGVRQHLGQRLRVLNRGARDAPERQRTLRATLDWSHALLREDEKKVFRRLGVFVGGFGLELAQQLAADATTDAWDVLDLLGNLVDKSMVVVDTAAAAPRYRLLETTRAYACEQMELAGERVALQQAHAQAMVAMFDRRTRMERLGLETVDHWMQACLPEADNLRAAIDWAVAAGERPLSWSLANTAAEFMYEAGRYPECVAWMRRAEPLFGDDTPELVQARFQFGLAMVGLHGGVDGAERLRLLDAALATLERHPPSMVLVYVLCMRGYVAGICGDLALARRTLDRVHALTQLEPLAPLRAIPLYIEGMVLRFEGRPSEALAAYTDALPYARRHGDGRTLFYLQNNMAAVHHDMGHLDEAVEQYRRTIASLEASSRTDAEMMAFVLNWYAHALTAQGALDEACEQVRRSLPYCRRSVGVRHFAGMLGLLAARRGRLREAALLLGCDDAARQRRGEVRTPFDVRTMKTILALLGTDHTAERVAVWRLQGTALEEGEVADLVLG